MVIALNNPSPADSDYFGYAVAISGTRVLVGAAYDNTGATDNGSAYVYDLSSGTPTMPSATRSTFASLTPAMLMRPSGGR